MKRFLLVVPAVIAFVFAVLVWRLEFGPYNDLARTARIPTVWDWLELLVIPVAIAEESDGWSTSADGRFTTHAPKEQRIKEATDHRPCLKLLFL